MRTYRKILASLALPLALIADTMHAEITHNGTISIVRNHAATANSSLTESWTMIQLSGLTSGSGCPSGNQGAGDLAYLAIPEPERVMVSMAVSAYLGAQNVEAVIDETNLYDGKCRVVNLALTAVPVPTVITYNSFQSEGKAAEITLTSDTTAVSDATAPWRSIATIAPLSLGKKYYWEVTTTGGATDYVMLGVASDTNTMASIGYDATADGYAWHRYDQGQTIHDGVVVGPFVSFSNSDRLMVAFDPDGGKLWFGKNGTWQGDPSSYSGEAYNWIVGLKYPAVSFLRGAGATLIFDPDNFQFTPPTGFVPSTIN